VIVKIFQQTVPMKHGAELNGGRALMVGPTINIHACSMARCDTTFHFLIKRCDSREVLTYVTS